MEPTGTATAASSSVDDLAQRYRPQLAKLVTHAPTGGGWIHELKLDGYRAGAAIVGGEVRLCSRRGRAFDAAFPKGARGAQEFPSILTALAKLRVRDALLDGEIVALDDDGKSDFQALQNRAHGTNADRIVYFVFDLLWLDGVDVARSPLLRRKELLARLLLRAGPRVRLLEHLDVDGAAMQEHACALGVEGVVSKRADAPYRFGVRSDDWQKAKCELRASFVVGGFTDATSASRGLGSLLIGKRAPDGQLVWAGKVSRGPGLGDAAWRALRERLAATEQPTCPFVRRPAGWLGMHAHWVTPTLVADVRFTEWTAGGRVRHPTLERLHEDAPPAKRSATEERRERVAGVTLTKASTTAFAGDAPITRFELARFYESIAAHALPHLVQRPLTLVRCRGPVSAPDALRTHCEFVRHTATWNRFVPAWVPRVQIPEQKKVGEYVVIDGLPALVALVDHGVVELHQWNARAHDVEHPDRVVFDLDPGEGVSFTDIVSAARMLRRHLERRGLDSRPKTTGGRGLHVVVPLAPRYGWDEVFAFSRAVAEALARKDAKLTTAFAKGQRVGRVLVDYKRNHRAAVAVAPYSVRAQPHAPVAVPLAWREVTPKLRPERFTLRTVPRRLARADDDPWADLDADQTLP